MPMVLGFAILGIVAQAFLRWADTGAEIQLYNPAALM